VWIAFLLSIPAIPSPPKLKLKLERPLMIRHFAGLEQKEGTPVGTAPVRQMIPHKLGEMAVRFLQTAT
jgi:hypothetical protein